MDISYALFSYAFNMLNKETVNALHLFSLLFTLNKLNNVWWFI